MSDTRFVDGGCLCGAVRFRLALPSKWCAHCHCTQCRRFHGAGYVTWAGFESDRFELLEGQDALRWFNSSPGAERGFCGTCGSSMLFRSERWKSEAHVVLGSLDGPIDRAPEAHVFHDTCVDWMALDESLPRVQPTD